MHAHPVFADLLLHSDDELALALQSAIVERETIHAWPLSCVQRLCLADGTRLIYKSQLPPTVEPTFYARAASPLLPGQRTLGELGRCVTMVLDWIEAPLLRDVAHSAAEFVDHGRRVVADIGAIAGDVPVYVDLGSPSAWSTLVEGVLADLRQLIEDGRFGLTDLGQVEGVRSWATDGTVVGCVTAGARLAHGDLTAEQVFVTAEGYRVVDWQRPVVAPPEVDLVALLVGAGLDPRPHVCATSVRVFWFLRLHWAVEAQAHLFPDGRWPIFDQWAAEAIRHLLE
jgi:hypothetical protein